VAEEEVAILQAELSLGPVVDHCSSLKTAFQDIAAEIVDPKLPVAESISLQVALVAVITLIQVVQLLQDQKSQDNKIDATGKAVLLEVVIAFADQSTCLDYMVQIHPMAEWLLEEDSLFQVCR